MLICNNYYYQSVIFDDILSVPLYRYCPFRPHDYIHFQFFCSSKRAEKMDAVPSAAINVHLTYLL